MSEKFCLECTLPICDDRSKECRYVQIIGRDRKVAMPKEPGKRAEYFSERHQATYTPVEVDRRTLPETSEKRVATQRELRRKRVSAALARRRETKNK